MLARILNGVRHPVLAWRYVARKALDSALDRPSVEGFVERQLMDRKLPRSLKAAGKAGIPVKVVYDIGARHGYWSEYLSRHVKAEYILFEANDEHAPQLGRRGFRFFTGVLSDAEKDVTWFGKGGTGDSYYKENTANYAGVGSITRRATTLDTLVEANTLPLPDLVKLDTQGSEIDIMEGGRKAIDHASFVYIECSLVDYNAGAPRLTDVLAFMEGRGFLPCDIGESHRKGGALIQIDVLFVRRDIYLRNPETAELHY